MDNAEEAPPPCPPDHGQSLPFAALVDELFEPLARLMNVGKGKTDVMIGDRRRNKTDAKIDILKHFIARWQHDVGQDLFPVFRLSMQTIQ